MYLANRRVLYRLVGMVRRIFYNFLYSFRYSVLGRRELRFIHIPRTGGTAIEEAGLKINRRWGKYDPAFRLGWVNSKIRCNYWHYPQSIAGPLFAVVRNPYERLISEFRYQQQEISEYSAINLNKWVINKLPQIEPKPYIDAGHFIPQAEYVKYCNHVLLYENIQDDFDALMDKYQLTRVKLERQHGIGDRRRELPNVPIHYLTQDDLDANVKEMILKQYAEDFELWNVLKIQQDNAGDAKL